MKPEQKEELLALALVIGSLAILYLCYLLFEMMEDQI